jgi:hypothetical protein
MGRAFSKTRRTLATSQARVVSGRPLRTTKWLTAAAALQRRAKQSPKLAANATPPIIRDDPSEGAVVGLGLLT